MSKKAELFCILSMASILDYYLVFRICQIMFMANTIPLFSSVSLKIAALIAP